MQMRKLRRRARKLSLQILYACEIGGFNPADVFSGEVTIPEVSEIDDYAADLCSGTYEHRQEIDCLIDKYSQNWDINRLPIVDKNLLRQTIYEMKYFEDVPVSASINEAVEIAKSFCAKEDSHKYINGILGKVAKTLDEE